MIYFDFDSLYDQDERLSQLQQALETESGERKRSVKKAIEHRKKELREELIQEHSVDISHEHGEKKHSGQTEQSSVSSSTPSPQSSQTSPSMRPTSTAATSDSSPSSYSD